IEFCDNSPIIGDSCNAPTGLDLHAAGGSPTLVLANQSGITDFQIDATGTTTNLLVLKRAGGGQSVNQNGAITVDLGTTSGCTLPALTCFGVTNPATTNTTFYARILTYATQAAAEGYTSTSVGSPVDAGGIALSTAEQITITAKVQERLTFCVFITDG